MKKAEEIYILMTRNEDGLFVEEETRESFEEIPEFALKFTKYHLYAKEETAELVRRLKKYKATSRHAKCFIERDFDDIYTFLVVLSGPDAELYFEKALAFVYEGEVRMKSLLSTNFMSTKWNICVRLRPGFFLDHERMRLCIEEEVPSDSYMNDVSCSITHTGRQEHDGFDSVTADIFLESRVFYMRGLKFDFDDHISRVKANVKDIILRNPYWGEKTIITENRVKVEIDSWGANERDER